MAATFTTPATAAVVTALPSRPLGVFGSAGRTVLTWLTYRSVKSDLEALPAHLQRDIGIDGDVDGAAWSMAARR